MDFRQKMLAIISGQKPDRPLFVPRLDIWHNANRMRGTLPTGFENLSLPEIADTLGVGLHAVIPDFLRTGNLQDIHHRALGFYNHPDFPYRADFSGVDYQVAQTESELIVTYSGPTRQIATRIRYGEELFRSGVSIPDITEPAIKGPDDYTALAEVYSKVRIVKTPGNYQKFHERIGGQGLAVAHLMLAGSPMQHILRDLRKVELLFMDQFDCPEQVGLLAEALSPLYEAIIDSVLDTPAEIALLGANYDDTITYPPFFAEHIKPWLAKAAERLHARGKYLLTHTDGENRLLMDHLVESRFDIADSVCPAPMTRLSLADYRQKFNGRITIWGGIPSVILLKSVCGWEDFKNQIHTIIESSRPWDRLIFSVADTLPPDADFDRVLYIRDQIEKMHV